MRLIDADALGQIITEKFQEHYGNTVYQFIHDFFTFVIRQIRKAPTVEAEPVKHGWWVLKERAHYFKCSLCNEPIPYKFGYSESWRYYNYCPNCGAKMDGKSCVPRTEDGGAE